MSNKKWYIKERHNPQFKAPYYVACGQLTKKEAKKKENPIYGSNYMLPFDTEEEYNKELTKLGLKEIIPC